MPDVVNSSESDARKAIEGAGLTANVTQAADDTVAAGNVVSTDPAAGTPVQVGGTVNVVVSSGPDAVQVPDVRGQSQEAARQTLQEAGFTVGNVNTVDDASVGKGEVVSTDPKIGASAPKGSAVGLNIASGQVTVPDVVGQSQTDALKQLNDLGFNVNTRETSAQGDGEPGSVVDQSLQPGTKVDSGTAINLVVQAQPTATDTPSASPTGSSSPSPSGSPTSGATGGSSPTGGSGDAQQ
jgi:serine/threonine-protein kinase